jgi:hypothetical protein
MNSRKDIYRKYFQSDIFSLSSSSILSPKIRVRQPQRSLAKTKDDLFNTEIHSKIHKASKSGIKRQKDLNKIYGSDIFFRKKLDRTENRTGVKKIRNSNNFSSCFEPMKDNEEFKREINSYAAEHRRPKREYNPDKYILKESPSERFYDQYYESHGSDIFPERPFSTGPECRRRYANNKKNLKKDTQKMDDCGVDQKKKPGEHIGQYTERKRYPKNNKIIFSDKKNNNFYSNPNVSAQTASKINRQILLESHILTKQEKEGEKNKNTENIKVRINEDRLNNLRDDYYHLGNENPRRDLKDNDPTIWGAYRTKWIRTNIDWASPETEVMFANTFSKEMKKNYGPKGPNAFQRKLNQLADSKNIDTITNIKKESIVNIKKPLSEAQLNEAGFRKIDKALNEIPNLKEDKKLKIRNNATTAIINGENNWDEKVKGLNRYYTNNRIIVNRKENLENREKTGHDFSEFVLTYPVKGQFEKFNESDIKTMFGSKGVHVYDIRKNMFDKGTYNIFNFKVRENEGEENLKKRINEVKKDLEKQNCKIKIERKEKKDLRKKLKNFISCPGEKLAIMNENAELENKEKNRYQKIPKHILKMHSFSKQFQNIDYKFKQAK